MVVLNIRPSVADHPSRDEKPPKVPSQSTLNNKTFFYFIFPSDQELTLTDDTVLEEHYEDPRLLQIKLLGEGVVESILRGETVGITSRRSRASSQVTKLAVAPP